MKRQYTGPEICIDFLCGRLTLSRLPGPKLHIRSTTITAECSGHTYSKTYEEDFDLLGDTNDRATIEHSRADPWEVCSKVGRCTDNSKPITLSVSVKINDGRPAETATFVVRFANGKLVNAEPVQD